MAERSRDTSGRFEGKVTDDDVVAAVRAHDPAATSEVAGALDVSRQAVDRRLRRLRDDGRVSSKKIGASLVWFTPRTRETGETPAHDDGDGFDVDDLQGDASTTLADDADAHDDESDGVELATPDTHDADTRAAVDAVAETWEDDARLSNRKDAAATVVQHALDTGDAIGKSHDVVDAVRDAYPVDGQNAETYWRKNIRPVLKEHGDYSKALKAYTIDDVEP